MWGRKGGSFCHRLIPSADGTQLKNLGKLSPAMSEIGNTIKKKL
jgi:hypothetical protein